MALCEVERLLCLIPRRFIVAENKASASVVKSFLELGEIKVPFDWMTVVTRWLQRRAGPLVCQEPL